VLNNPADAIDRILKASDEHGRKKTMALIDQWPADVRNAVSPQLIDQRKRRIDRSKDEKRNFPTLTNGCTGAFVGRDDPRGVKILKRALSHPWPKLGRSDLGAAEASREAAKM
jgi:hypothetical protein